MPLLTSVNIKAQGLTTVAMTTLDGATDTFSLSNGLQSLVLSNPTAGAITCTLIGDAAPATVNCDGVGSVPVAAESVTVGVGETVYLYVSALNKKLSGVVTISTGAGLEAALISY